MDSFDFDRLGNVALDQTLAYLNAYPEPQDHDMSFVQMFNNAVTEGDWSESPKEFVAGGKGESRTVEVNLRQCRSTSSMPLGSNEPSPSSDIFPFQGVWNGSLEVNFSPGSMPAFESSSDNGMTLGRGPEIPRKASQCSWDGCPHSSHLGPDFTIHLKDHGRQALINWEPPLNCMWQGCKSKAVFKSLPSYKHHLENIHTHPILCTVSKFKHQNPFRNEDDLDRHRSTAHSSLRPYICPFDDCPEETKTFARKDKWLKHIRETTHEGDKFCPHYHCALQRTPNDSGFQTREEISKHFAIVHSAFESNQFICALGACAFNLQPEQWTEYNLRDHLRKHHLIHHAYSAAIQARLEGISQVLRAEHLKGSLHKWQDCTLCTQRQRQQDFQLDQMGHHPLAFDNVPTDFASGMFY